jgi:hypothetical protein
MIDTPQITQGPAKLTAIIHLTIPRSKIRLIMGPGISELMVVAVVKAQGIGLAGPWFTHVVLTAPVVAVAPVLGRRAIRHQRSRARFTTARTRTSASGRIQRVDRGERS